MAALHKRSFTLASILVVVPLLIFTSAGCSRVRELVAATQKIFVPPNAKYDEVVVGSSRGFILRPKSTVAGRWVWFAPTLLWTIKGKDEAIPGEVNEYIFSKLIDSGITIAGVDVAESYGSRAGIDIYSTFYRVLVDDYGLSGKPCLFAQSRGALMIFNWASENPEKVQCIGAIYPVLNLASWPRDIRDDDTQRRDAANAFGLPLEKYLNQRTELSPISHVDSLAKKGVTILLVHGTNDDIVKLSENSEEFVKRYKLAGGSAKLMSIDNEGHNKSSKFFRNDGLISFFRKSLALKERQDANRDRF